jgi:hypothetical protein
MKARKPITDEEGEVRELLMEDIRRFRPIAQGLSPSLAEKLGIEAEDSRDAGAKAARTRKPKRCRHQRQLS